MLEWKEAKTGERIPLLKGISLASLYNPIQEAKKWVDAKEIKEFHKNIFVLGLAGGFHIKELIKRYPNKKILVFEIIPDFVHEFTFQSEQLKIIQPNCAKEIWKISAVTQAISEPYVILEHRVSTRLNPSYYEDLINELSCRTKESFFKSLNYRNEQRILFENQNIEASGILSFPQAKQDQRYYYIKDLLESKSLNRINNESSVIWKLLGELLQ